MSEHSAIGWTDATWNPVTGCSHVSEGCRHCYAETLSLRMGWSKKPWTAQNAVENVKLHADRLDQPFSWRKPRRVFVNSMSDLFHEQVHFEFIAAVFLTMVRCPRHTFQVLTKRPARMREFMRWMEDEDAAVGGNLRDESAWPAPNVWLGVSCEDQRTADERIPILLNTPAAVRFISAEPLLGPIDLSAWTGLGSPARGWGLHWIIVGGESGPGFRDMDPAWAHQIVGLCNSAGIPVFVKQDSGPKPGKRGRLSDFLWAFKDYPQTVPA